MGLKLWRPRMEQRTWAGRCRGSAMLVAIVLMGVTVIAAAVCLWSSGIVLAQAKATRSEIKRQSSESLVLSAMVAESIPAIQAVMAKYAVAGQFSVNANEVVTELQNALVSRLGATDASGNKIYASLLKTLDLASVKISYAPMPIHNLTVETNGYSDPNSINLVARPFTIQSPDNNPSGYNLTHLECLPVGHPLIAYTVRRYPFSISFRLKLPELLGKELQITRQISLYQLPVSQFARLSQSDIGADGTNVSVSIDANSKVNAVGTINNSNVSGVRNIIASQINGYSNSTSDAYNLGSVHTGSSHLGGRLFGETWNLLPPHFYSSRISGEKSSETGRPVYVPGQVYPKAYDAQTFFEVLFHPASVQALDPTQGIVTVVHYNTQGVAVQTWEGRMMGQLASETPAYQETLFDNLGNTTGIRTSMYSSSLPFAGLGSRANMDFMAYMPGNYLFRVSSSSGERVVISVDGVPVADSDSQLNHSSWAQSVTMSGGWHSLWIERTGSMGTIQTFVTPPGLAEAWTTQWSVAGGFSSNGSNMGTLADGAGTPSPSFLSWRLLPAGMNSNTTNECAASLVFHMDQVWPFEFVGGSSVGGHVQGADIVIYAEGVIPGQSRYFSTTLNGQPTLFSPVIIELCGNGYSANILSQRSFTIMTPNPVVLNGDIINTSWNSLYLMSQGVQGVGVNSVYVGFDQALLSDVNIGGVVSGEIAQLLSYFDRQSPQQTKFRAQGHLSSEDSPFYRNLVLIDDHIYSESEVTVP